METGSLWKVWECQHAPIRVKASAPKRKRQRSMKFAPCMPLSKNGLWSAPAFIGQSVVTLSARGSRRCSPKARRLCWRVQSGRVVAAASRFVQMDHAHCSMLQERLAPSMRGDHLAVAPTTAQQRVAIMPDVMLSILSIGSRLWIGNWEATERPLCQRPCSDAWKNSSDRPRIALCAYLPDLSFTCARVVFANSRCSFGRSGSLKAWLNAAMAGSASPAAAWACPRYTR